MEKKKTETKTPIKKKPAETSNEKISRLTNSVEALSSELETIKSDIQKSKSENSTLSSELEALKLNAQKGKSADEPLTTSVAALSAELDILKLNVQKRKSENTTLKILFYTGLIVLLLGFLYTNSTLQRAQMDSMESNINSLRTLMNMELLSVEKNVFQKIDLLEKNAGEQSKVNLQEGLENMTQAISRLDIDHEKTTELIDLVRKNSRELQEAYSEQEQMR